MFDEHREATVLEKRRVKGTFLENMELGQFPFDCQVRTLLQLLILTERAKAHSMDQFIIGHSRTVSI